MFGLKKKTDTTLKWHPDFRIIDQLPDTKIVRTKFLINLLGITIASILTIFVGYREINKIGLSQSISTIENEINSSNTSNTKFMRMSNEFRMYSNQLLDLNKFKKQPISVNELLVELSRMRTEDVVFDEIDLQNNWDKVSNKEVYLLKLTGKGRTTADIAELKNRLEILDIPKTYELRISEEGNPTKDAETGIFSFIILVTITEASNGNK